MMKRRGTSDRTRFTSATPTAEATVGLKDDGLYRGDGAFEVIRLYQGKPFWLPELGPVAVLALPVLDESNGPSGVVEALVSWQAIGNEFRDEAHREVRVSLVDRDEGATDTFGQAGLAFRSLYKAGEFLKD